jgi:iron complex outermembrane receptor protein
LGSYFRAPSFGELYGSIGLVNGNPDLVPEEGINADLGFLYSRQAYELRGTFFASFRDQLIVTSFDSRGVGRPVNSGAAEVFGVELAASWTVSPRLTLSSNITWQSPKSVDYASGFYDNFLPGESQLAWFGRAEYYFTNWTAWYDIDVQNKRFYDRANILPATNTVIHSTGLGWNKHDWKFSLSANNLGNDTVEDFNGFPKPGRTLHLVTTYSF